MRDAPSDGENIGDDQIFQEDILQTYRIVPTNYNDTICPGYVHGYGVLERFGPATAQDLLKRNFVRLDCIKILLDNSMATSKIKEKLLTAITSIGKTTEQIISDYITVVLLHTKHHMYIYGHGYTSDSQVELACGVPCSWSPTTNAIIAKCITNAMSKAELGIPTDGSSPKLYLVKEPEAHILHALHYLLPKLNV